jgi:thiamine biosynthesis lipoprotein
MTTQSDNARVPSRRAVLRILAVGGAAGVAWKLGLFDRFRGRPVTRTRTLMGTFVNLTVLGDHEEATAAADATLQRMAELEALLSRHREDSELSRLNAAGRMDAPSQALLDVLRLGERVSRMGDGAFDVSVQPVLELYDRDRPLPAPKALEEAVGRVDHRALRITDDAIELTRPGMRLTLDGVGKGYVVDRGLEVLKQRGFGDVFVEAGGDLVASGNRDGGVPWRVGIRNPRPGLSLQTRFDASDVAVATSGDYMQSYTEDFTRHHIVDPRSGHSAPELASSTVIAPNAATADALSTLTLVLGPSAGRDLLESLPACEGYFISKQLEITRTTGFVTS